MLTCLLQITPSQYELLANDAQWMHMQQRASVADTIYSSVHQSLASLWLNADVNLPIAAWRAKADGLMVEEPGLWWCADPVELQADHRTAFLIGQQHLGLTIEEVVELAAMLRPWVEEEGMTLYTPHPLRWYLHVPTAEKMQSYSPETITGKNLSNYLPQGEQTRAWHRRWTEWCMALYNHRVNQARAAQDKPLINGVWFWGQGEAVLLPTCPWSAIITQTHWGQGLAQTYKLLCFNLSEINKSSWHNTATKILMIIDSENFTMWQQQLWPQLFETLKTARTSTITWILPEQPIYTVAGRNLHAWWKRWWS